MPTKTIAYFRNGLGNFILMTPALQALASMEPDGKIDICIDAEWNDDRRSALIEIIKALPFVEGLINYPENNFTKDYNTWFWTRHTYPSKAMEVFKAKDPRFDIGVSWQASGKHEIYFYMELVSRFCGYDGETPEQYFPVDEKYVVPDKEYIALCNGSYGHLRLSKEWYGFGTLAKVIKYYYPEYQIVKLGYRDELHEVGCADYDFVGETGILETAKLIKNCKLLITTDTCNMHIGDALRVPMVVLWGGSILSKNSPVNGTAEIVSAGLKCQPCHEIATVPDCKVAKCMQQIGVGDVIHRVRKVLSD